ncbi:MAG: aminopeptidase, partial [Bacteroidales bacterium]
MEKIIEKYIELIVKKGVNIQENQPVYINGSVEEHDFIVKLTKQLYENGASEVYINWTSEEMGRLSYTYQTTEKLKNIDEWVVERYKSFIERDAAFISLSSRNPEGLAGVDLEKINEHSKALMLKMAPYQKKTMNDENTWCVVSTATQKWAEKVYPNDDNPKQKLWEAILYATKSNLDNPIEEWEQHVQKLKKMSEKLNNESFEYLHFTNKLGTDLKVGLVKKHIWASGESVNKTLNIVFNANIPTEEVFTMPDKYNVNGKVVSTKALNYNGSLIKDFWIEFKNGKAIKWDAKENKEILTKLIETDENSSYLGEVALVEADNPIAQLDILFYNTLFDENASCHLALGKAYPTNIDEDLSKYSKEEKSDL